MTGDEYMFGSILTYLPSIQMARGVSGILLLRHRLLDPAAQIPIRLYSNTYYNLRARFPQLEDPHDEVSPVRGRLARQLRMRRKEFNNDKEFLQQQAAIVRELIASLTDGELLELQTAKHVVPRLAARKLIDSATALMGRFHSSISRGESLVDDMFLLAIATRQYKQLSRCLRGWETMKIIHEGAPPYHSTFGKETIEKILALNPHMELPKPVPHLSKRQVRTAIAQLSAGSKVFPDLITPAVVTHMSGLADSWVSGPA